MHTTQQTCMNTFNQKGSNICARHHINGIRNLFLCCLCLCLPILACMHPWKGDSNTQQHICVCVCVEEKHLISIWANVMWRRRICIQETEKHFYSTCIKEIDKRGYWKCVSVPFNWKFFYSCFVLLFSSVFSCLFF